MIVCLVYCDLIGRFKCNMENVIECVCFKYELVLWMIYYYVIMYEWIELWCNVLFEIISICREVMVCWGCEFIFFVIVCLYECCFVFEFYE